MLLLSSGRRCLAVCHSSRLFPSVRFSSEKAPHCLLFRGRLTEKKHCLCFGFEELKKPPLLMSLPQGTGKSPNQLFNVSISRRTEKSTMSSEGTSVVKMVITSEVISTTPLFCVFDKNLHFSQNSVFLIFSLFLRQKSLF